jgi:hypothetical protein
MDSTLSIKLADGTLNDWYYHAGGIHITRAATNKLVRNLKLRIKDNVEGACRNAKNVSAKKDNSSRQRLVQFGDASQFTRKQTEQHFTVRTSYFR